MCSIQSQVKPQFYLSPLNWGLETKGILNQPTILDKTVDKIVYLDSIFLNIVAVPVLPSPPSPESNVVVYSKESLIPGRLWEATLNWGKGFSFRKGVVLEIVLLRRKVDMMGKPFSSSFVRDCSLNTGLLEGFYLQLILSPLIRWKCIDREFFELFLLIVWAWSEVGC